MTHGEGEISVLTVKKEKSNTGPVEQKGANLVLLRCVGVFVCGTGLKNDPAKAVSLFNAIEYVSQSYVYCAVQKLCIFRWGKCIYIV